MTNNTVRCLGVLALSVALVFTAASIASADKGHGVTFGEPGKASQASRMIPVTMSDNAFQPKTVMVRSGETIRFVVKNTGQLLHEFNIGTPEMHAEHRKEMLEMLNAGMITATGINQAMMTMDHSKMDHSKMDHSQMAAMKAPMKHDDPNSVLLEPGKTAELVWKFKEAAKLEFSCNVPGHAEAGMVGQVKFTR